MFYFPKIHTFQEKAYGQYFRFKENQKENLANISTGKIERYKSSVVRQYLLIVIFGEDTIVFFSSEMLRNLFIKQTGRCDDVIEDCVQWFVYISGDTQTGL